MRLGQRLRDRVTGFEGIAVARLEFLNGCVQFCLKPPAKDNKVEDGQYIDAHQLEVLDDGISTPRPGTGGAMADTPRSDRYRG